MCKFPSKITKVILGEQIFVIISCQRVRLVFVAYGNLVWSLLLTVEFGLVFFAYGGKSV